MDLFQINYSPSAPLPSNPTPTQDDLSSSFAVFSKLVEPLVTGKAGEKGYARPGETGRDLMDFVKDNFGGHALGEIVYKLIRWNQKHNPEDILKVAAWAFLEWDQYQRRGAK